MSAEADSWHMTCQISARTARSGPRPRKRQGRLPSRATVYRHLSPFCPLACSHDSRGRSKLFTASESALTSSSALHLNLIVSPSCDHRPHFMSPSAQVLSGAVILILGYMRLLDCSSWLVARCRETRLTTIRLNYYIPHARCVQLMSRARFIAFGVGDGPSGSLVRGRVRGREFTRATRPYGPRGSSRLRGAGPPP